MWNERKKERESHNQGEDRKIIRRKKVLLQFSCDNGNLKETETHREDRGKNNEKLFWV
jgi:hypothetical protein